MTHYEFEILVGERVTSELFYKIQQIFWNTEAIQTKKQMVSIYQNCGAEYIEVMYSLVEERGKMIHTIGDLRQEVSDLKKQNRKLREFKKHIMDAYEEGGYGKQE